MSTTYKNHIQQPADQPEVIQHWMERYGQLQAEQQLHTLTEAEWETIQKLVLNHSDRERWADYYASYYNFPDLLRKPTWEDLEQLRQNPPPVIEVPTEDEMPTETTHSRETTGTKATRNSHPGRILSLYLQRSAFAAAAVCLLVHLTGFFPSVQDSFLNRSLHNEDTGAIPNDDTWSKNLVKELSDHNLAFELPAAHWQDINMQSLGQQLGQLPDSVKIDLSSYKLRFYARHAPGDNNYIEYSLNELAQQDWQIPQSGLAKSGSGYYQWVLLKGNDRNSLKNGHLVVYGYRSLLWSW